MEILKSVLSSNVLQMIFLIIIVTIFIISLTMLFKKSKPEYIQTKRIVIPVKSISHIDIDDCTHISRIVYMSGDRKSNDFVFNSMTVDYYSKNEDERKRSRGIVKQLEKAMNIKLH